MKMGFPATCIVNVLLRRRNRFVDSVPACDIRSGENRLGRCCTHPDVGVYAVVDPDRQEGIDLRAGVVFDGPVASVRRLLPLLDLRVPERATAAQAETQARS